VTIAVRPVSDAPRLEVGANFKTNIGQLLRVVINGFDPDAGQMLTLTNSQLPAGAKIERVTGTSWVFEWRPTSQQIGSYSVDLTLRDDGAPSLSDMKSINLVVDATWTPSVILSPDLVVISALLVVGDEIFAGTEGAGIYRSLDNGATWGEANTGLPNTNDARYVFSLTVSSGTIFAGTNGAGIYRSLNNGATWSEANSGLPAVAARYVRSLTVSGGAIIVGTGTRFNELNPEGAGIYRSLNNGATWSEANSGLPAGAARRVFALTASGGAIIAGTYGAGIYRSLETGATW
jgi:hypothetical protein